MNKLKLLALGVAFAATSGAANAAVYYADKVIDSNYGTCTASPSVCTSFDRKDPTNALGVTDGSFYSLGLGGDLTVGFAKALFTATQKVVTFEITFGSVPKTEHFEAVDVYSILGGAETYLGRILNLTGIGQVTSSGPFEYIRLADATEDEYGAAGTTSSDGFDVDSVKIAPVPLPAAGGMLLLGMAGMAALRRRKNAA